MISSVKVDLRAYTWNEGEQPVQVPFADDVTDDLALQRTLMHLLETKEYGKFTRTYPGNAHVEGGELTMWYRAFTDEYRGRVFVSGVDEAERDASLKSQKDFCAQHVFTPAELYALKPTGVDYGSWHTINVHLSDDVANYYDLATNEIEETQRMETRTLVDHDYDGRRGWTLQTVWFDNKPVMVVNSSGRDGDEYHERWITDPEQFAALVTFLKSFAPQ